MALIKIEDLPQSIELDREAMIATRGGARSSGQRVPVAGPAGDAGRIVDYPPGFDRTRLKADAQEQRSAS